MTDFKDQMSTNRKGVFASMAEAPSASAFGVGPAWIGGLHYWSDSQDWQSQVTALSVFAVAAHDAPSTHGFQYVCDGTRDDIEINAAIVAAKAAGGGIVRLSKGTFNTERPLLFDRTDGVSIIGQGVGATIVKVKSAWISVIEPGGSVTIAGAVAFVGATNYECLGFTVDLTDKVPASVPNGIISVGAVDFTVRCERGDVHHCEVLSPAGDNYLYWIQNGKDVHYHHNKADGGYSAYTAGSDQQGFEIFGGERCSFEFNHASNIGGMAYLVQTIASHQGGIGQSAWPCKDITVRRNTFGQCRDGLVANSSYDATAGAADLVNVQFLGNSGGNCYRYGVYLLAASGNATTKPKWDGVLFADNRITGESTANGAPTNAMACYVYNAAGVTDTNFVNATIRGNHFSEFAQDGSAGFVTITGCSNIVFDSNKVVNAWTLTSNSRGILTTSTCTGLKISRNVIDGARIYAIDLSSGSSDCEIVENKVLNWNQYAGGAAAIMLNGATNTVVRGNRFQATVTTSMGSLVNFGTANGVSANDNEYVTSTGSNIPVYGFGTATNTNRGQLTASAATGTITSNRIRSNSVLTVNRRTGDQAVTTIVPANGSAVVSFAAAATGVYDWIAA